MAPLRPRADRKGGPNKIPRRLGPLAGSSQSNHSNSRLPLSSPAPSTPSPSPPRGGMGEERGRRMQTYPGVPGS
eukprot:6598224-Pyramimonas_sp.AAC.1